MIKSTKRCRISAVFLAAVITAGIIATISPSFMTPAQADPYSYGMDNYNKKYPSYEKSYEKSSSAQYNKCVNVNVVVSGVNIGDRDNDLTTSALRDSGPSGGSSGGPDGGSHGFKSFDKDFVFVCINKNDNRGIGGGVTPPIEPTECDDCFKVKQDGGPLTPGQLNQINRYLATNDVTLGANPDNAGIVGDVQGLCDLIVQRNSPPENNPGTEEQIRFILGEAIPGQGTNEERAIDDVVDCLLFLGLITPTTP